MYRLENGFKRIYQQRKMRCPERKSVEKIEECRHYGDIERGTCGYVAVIRWLCYQHTSSFSRHILYGAMEEIDTYEQICRSPKNYDIRTE